MNGWLRYQKQMGTLNSEGSRFFDRARVLERRNRKIARRGKRGVEIHRKRHWIQMIPIQFDEQPGEVLDRNFRNSDQEKESLLRTGYSIGSTWKTQGETTKFR